MLLQVVACDAYKGAKKKKAISDQAGVPDSACSVFIVDFPVRFFVCFCFFSDA